MSYRKRKDKDGYSINCVRCDSEAPTEEIGAEGFLCRYCAGTLLGNAIKHDHHDSYLAQGIIQAMNVLEKSLRRKP